MAMTAAVIIMLSSSSQGQTTAPSPIAGETNDQSSGANPSNSATSGGELEQVTVTGYLIPRVGEGPQPVATLNQDFIQKQAYQTINEVLNNYPGGLSGQNAQTFAGNSNSPGTSAYNLKIFAHRVHVDLDRRISISFCRDLHQRRNHSLR